MRCVTELRSYGGLKVFCLAADSHMLSTWLETFWMQTKLKSQHKKIFPEASRALRRIYNLIIANLKHKKQNFKKSKHSLEIWQQLSINNCKLQIINFKVLVNSFWFSLFNSKLMHITTDISLVKF